jgi:hypothetical protein
VRSIDVEGVPIGVGDGGGSALTLP